MQSSRSGVLLNHFPLDFIERGCLLNMELTKDQAGCPENFRDPSVSASLVLRCQTQVAKPGSYIGARDPNRSSSDLYSKATDPSPQVQDEDFLKITFTY